MDFLTLVLMMDNNPTPITKEFLEKCLYAVSIVVGFWKFVDAFFGLLHKRQRGFVSDIVKEELRNEIAPIKDHIAEIKRNREKDNQNINNQLGKIFDKLNK